MQNLCQYSTKCICTLIDIPAQVLIREDQTSLDLPVSKNTFPRRPVWEEIIGKMRC